MGGGFTKLFNSILDSTVWGLSKEARILWITILCKQDRHHYIYAPIPGLAREAVLTVEETEKALAELMQPDPYSTTKDYEGRRLIRDEKGLLIVNGQKYKDMINEEAAKKSKREWAANNRESKKRFKIPPSKPLPGEVSACAEELRIARAEEG